MQRKVLPGVVKANSAIKYPREIIFSAKPKPAPARIDRQAVIKM